MVTLHMTLKSSLGLRFVFAWLSTLLRLRVAVALPSLRLRFACASPSPLLRRRLLLASPSLRLPCYWVVALRPKDLHNDGDEDAGDADGDDDEDKAVDDDGYDDGIDDDDDADDDDNDDDDDDDGGDYDDYDGCFQVPTPLHRVPEEADGDGGEQL